MDFLHNPVTGIEGGVQTLTSGTSVIEIPMPLLYAYLIPFVAHNFMVLFGWTPTSVINFATWIYRSTIDWVASTYDSSSNTPPPSMPQNITVEVVKTSGSGIRAMFRGLPNDLDEAHLSSFLRTVLRCQYQPQLNTQPDAATPTNNTDTAAREPAQIDTAGRGLWNGTSVSTAVSHGEAKEAVKTGVDKGSKDGAADGYDGVGQDPLDIDAYTRD
ncbi:hypothetical protein EJ07DRAFT_181414 [Lizonia empirigonia]|nr:hypothetical protein EJ07DRAFT_181414 [Lizonia empirigonia]